MQKINILETPAELARRRRTEEVCRQYLSWSGAIKNGQIRPNRIIQTLARTMNMSGEGIKRILRHNDIYRSASEPLPTEYSRQNP